MQRMHVLQGRSFELAYATTVSECFRIINATVRDIYRYDRVTLLE